MLAGKRRDQAGAIGRDGAVQSPVRATSFPDGSSGIQEVVVNVT